MANQRKETSFSGIVTARNCPECGHHEMGLVTEDGVFHPLRPGTRVLIMDGMEPGRRTGVADEIPLDILDADEPLQAPKGRFWIPEPLKGDGRMRLKYGVILLEGEPVFPDGQIYESAFLRKLAYLLEKGADVPVPVILDRLFAAPHLAAGEPKDIVCNMWEELSEIREPVEHLKKWLETRDGNHLQSLVLPDRLEDLENATVSEAEALEEQKKLDLEAFLALF